MPDYRERNDDMGLLFVANGVTSVRQMHGHPIGDELRVRSRGVENRLEAIVSTNAAAP